MTIRMQQPAPPLAVPLAGGGFFDLARTTPRNFTLIVFYRGYHCRRCKDLLGEIDALLPEFEKRGVEVVAVSSDTAAQAERSRKEWKLERLRIGFDFDVDIGRQWGLFISRGIKEEEPSIFTEPGLFLVDRDGRLTVAVINSITRMRPYPRDVLDTIDRILEVPDLARGEA